MCRSTKEVERYEKDKIRPQRKKKTEDKEKEILNRTIEKESKVSIHYLEKYRN